MCEASGPWTTMIISPGEIGLSKKIDPGSIFLMPVPPWFRNDICFVIVRSDILIKIPTGAHNLWQQQWDYGEKTTETFIVAIVHRVYAWVPNRRGYLAGYPPFGGGARNRFNIRSPTEVHRPLPN